MVHNASTPTRNGHDLASPRHIEPELDELLDKIVRLSRRVYACEQAKQKTQEVKSVTKR